MEHRKAYRWLGSKEQARQLWENEEALGRYLERLRELMEGDSKLEPDVPEVTIQERVDDPYSPSGKEG